MRKGYKSIPPCPGEKHVEIDEKTPHYSFYPRRNQTSWFRRLISPKEKEKMSRRTWLKKTKGVRLLFTLVFCTLSMYFIHRFIHHYYAQLALPFQNAFDLVRNIPSSDHLRSHHLNYTSLPHIAGSGRDETLANWTRDTWREYGITDTQIETFYPTLNYPDRQRLAIIEPAELALEANLGDNQVPAFHAYSGTGNVTGPVVYVNYGQFSDFSYLQTNRVDFRGTIALIRNGVIPKGLKIKMAEQFGCIGVVLFSTPSCQQDDTLHNFIERGSVEYLSYGVGDPSTPGYPATRVNTSRVPLQNTTFVPKIPSLPISWQEAIPFLKTTEGLGVAADSLCDAVYFSGPSKARVNLVNINTYHIKPVWNVIGTIEGSEEPNRTILLGSHRDAWEYGTNASSSGSAVMMELVRTLGVLLQRGWRPKRTIKIASWDAKEYGMVGSTEWMEQHATWLKEHVVAYINVDHAVSGKHFSAQASPLLRRLLYQVTDQVIDPESSISVYARWRVEKAQDTDRPLTDLLGINHDHVSFFYHLGIPSISMGFHSSDSTVFNDAMFEYHQALTKIWGLVVLRLSSDALLPLSPQDYTNAIVRSIQGISAQQGCLTFPYISSALHSLAATSIQFERTMRQRRRQLQRKHVSAKVVQQVDEMNERLVRFESSFLDEQGLGRSRGWFKHLVYGPHISGVPVTFPSLREAVEKDNIVHIKWVEERIGQVLIQADRTLRGEDDDEFDQDDD